MDVLGFPFQSAQLRKVQSEIQSLAQVRATVLIIGERGTGKTTWAQSLCRYDGVAIVIESSDAPKSFKGWKDLNISWDKHPVILENIDKWSEATQSSFALFYKESQRLFKRLVATASSRLNSKVREEQFRSDVYYSLSVRKIELPKLNDCVTDIQSLSFFWLEVSGLMLGKKCPVLSAKALEKLKDHSWVGNFTEFVNVIERSLTYAEQTIEENHIEFEDLHDEISALEAGLTLAEVEKKLIMQTLNLTAQNKSQAARLLGISIRTLRNKLNEYRQEVSGELI